MIRNSQADATGEANEVVNDMYVDSIKAKLLILDEIQIR